MLRATPQFGARGADLRCINACNRQLYVRHLPVAAAKSETAAEEKPNATPQVGFRWDPTLQRWQTDKRVSATVWENVPRMQTKTGGDYIIWPVIHTALVGSGLQTVGIEEAEKLATEGATFVDVRTAADYQKEHIKGAVSVPMFVPVAGQDTFDQIKKFVMAVAFAMTATERNPNFAQDAEAVLKKNQKLIVYCGRGGTLKVGVDGRRGKFDDPDRSFGIESRSLKACYELLEAGFSDVVHLEKGLSNWRYNKKPTESSS